jgi:hypothetical protein
MEPIEQQPDSIQNIPPFDESAWIKLIFLLSDTQDWLNELANGALMQVPMKNRKRLLRKTYYVSVSALAHILQRHYFKIPRHPETSKFTIPVPEILSYLRDLSAETGVPVAGSLNFRRTVDVHRTIGFDKDQLPTSHITVLTDSGGRIITAFPGIHFINSAENTVI